MGNSDNGDAHIRALTFNRKLRSRVDDLVVKYYTEAPEYIEISTTSAQDISGWKKMIGIGTNDKLENQ
jgi:hypothetical protein